MNDEALNGPNCVYSLSDPPVWVPEAEDNVEYRVRLLVQMASLPTSGVTFEEPASAAIRALRCCPSQCRRSARIECQLQHQG